MIEAAEIRQQADIGDARGADLFDAFDALIRVTKDDLMEIQVVVIEGFECL